MPGAGCRPARESKTGTLEEEMAGPEGDRLIYVDMTNQTVSTEPFPDEWKLLGGPW